MPCEICGRENVKVYLTNIDGAQLWVCGDCNPTGEGRIYKREKTNFVKKDFKHKTFDKKTNKIRQKFDEKFKRYEKEDGFDLANYELVENFGDKIKKAREDKKLTLKEFANKLKESESYLQKIEQNKLKPNDRVLLKIYDVLKINLIKFDDSKNKKPEYKKKTFKDYKKKSNYKKYDSNTSVVIENPNAKKDLIIEETEMNHKRKIVF